MSTDVGAAGDKEEDRGSNEEGNRVGDRKERRKDSSHSGPMTERESSSTFMMDETGEAELHLARMHTPAAIKQPLTQNEQNQAVQSPDPQNL